MSFKCSSFVGCFIKCGLGYDTVNLRIKFEVSSFTCYNYKICKLKFTYMYQVVSDMYIFELTEMLWFKRSHMTSY